MSSNVLLPTQEQMILDEGLTRKKFDFDQIATDSTEFSLVVNGLTTIIEERISRPEVIVSVADGATRLGAALSTELELRHLSTSKTDDRIGFQVNTKEKHRNTRAVLIDDVFNTGTSLEKASLAAAATGLFVVGAAVILDRSDSPRSTVMYLTKRYNVQSLIKYPISTR